MKSGFIIVIFVIGMLVCATHAAPFRSEIQEEDNQQILEELLDLINQESKSHQQDVDGDKEYVAAQRSVIPYSRSSLLNKG